MSINTAHISSPDDFDATLLRCLPFGVWYLFTYGSAQLTRCFDRAIEGVIAGLAVWGPRAWQQCRCKEIRASAWCKVPDHGKDRCQWLQG